MKYPAWSIDSVRGDTAASRNFALAGGPAPVARFVDVNVAMVRQLQAQEYGDLAPAPAMLAGWAKTCEALGTALRRWQRVIRQPLAVLNTVLARNQITSVGAPSGTLLAPVCGG